MRLTTARYYTPSGTSIQATGIEPDIIVEQAKVEPLDAMGDPRSEADLRGHLSNDQEKEKNQTTRPELGVKDKDKDVKKDAKVKKDEKEEAKEDYQLLRALDLIRALSIYKQVLNKSS